MKSELAPKYMEYITMEHRPYLFDASATMTQKDGHLIKAFNNHEMNLL